MFIALPMGTLSGSKNNAANKPIALDTECNVSQEGHVVRLAIVQCFQ